MQRDVTDGKNEIILTCPCAKRLRSVRLKSIVMDHSLQSDPIFLQTSLSCGMFCYLFEILQKSNQNFSNVINGVLN